MEILYHSPFRSYNPLPSERAAEPFTVKEPDPPPLYLDEPLGCHLSEHPGDRLRYGAKHVGEERLRDVELNEGVILCTVAQVDEVGCEPGRDLLEGEPFDEARELPQTARQDCQHVHGEGRIAPYEIDEGGSRKEEEEAFLQGLGVGGKVTPRKDGHLSEGFLETHEVEHLLLSLR